MAERKSVRLVLTPEQREHLHRVSGQHIDAIEVEPDDSKGSGGVVRFLWRISQATGIPRQAWVRDDGKESA